MLDVIDTSLNGNNVVCQSLTGREKPRRTSAADTPYDSPPTLHTNGGLNGLHMKSDLRNGEMAAPNGRKRPRISLNKFRLPIYVQLCVVICILCGLCVMVVAVTTVCPFLLMGIDCAVYE